MNKEKLLQSFPDLGMYGKGELHQELLSRRLINWGYSNFSRFLYEQVFTDPVESERVKKQKYLTVIQVSKVFECILGE